MLNQKRRNRFGGFPLLESPFRRLKGTWRVPLRILRECYRRCGRSSFYVVVLEQNLRDHCAPRLRAEYFAGEVLCTLFNRLLHDSLNSCAVRFLLGGFSRGFAPWIGCGGIGGGRHDALPPGSRKGTHRKGSLDPTKRVHKREKQRIVFPFWWN